MNFRKVIQYCRDNNYSSIMISYVTFSEILNSEIFHLLDPVNEIDLLMSRYFATFLGIKIFVSTSDQKVSGNSFRIFLNKDNLIDLQSTGWSKEFTDDDIVCLDKLIELKAFW